jgi:hypothetical protein
MPRAALQRRGATPPSSGAAQGAGTGGAVQRWFNSGKSVSSICALC